MEGGFGEVAEGRHDALADGGVADDAAVADFVAFGFELGFDEGDDVGRDGEDAIEGGQDQAEGDEGDVGYGEGGGFGEVAGLEVAGVAGVVDDHAGIGGEAVMELGLADIHGMDPGRAVLEKAVGAAAGGGADVHADALPGGKLRKAEEGFFEFEAAAPDEAFGLADGQGGIHGDFVAGLGGGAAIHEDVAGEDEAFGFFAAFGEAALDKQQIEAGPLHLALRALRSLAPR